jgi:hypothetical protein
MATVYYFTNITSGASGGPWWGSMTVSSLNDVVKNTLPSSIIVTYPQAFNFAPQSVNYYSNEYVTWRTYTGSSQYPSVGDGYSMDIWSEELYTNVANDYTWNQLISFNAQQGVGLYTIRLDKFSVLYNYNVPCAIQNGKGGYFQLSTTPVPVL